MYGLFKRLIKHLMPTANVHLDKNNFKYLSRLLDKNTKAHSQLTIKICEKYGHVQNRALSSGTVSSTWNRSPLTVQVFWDGKLEISKSHVVFFLWGYPVCVWHTPLSLAIRLREQGGQKSAWICLVEKFNCYWQMYSPRLTQFHVGLQRMVNQL